MLCRSVLEMAALTGSTIDIWEQTSGLTTGMITGVGWLHSTGAKWVRFTKVKRSHAERKQWKSSTE